MVSQSHFNESSYPFLPSKNLIFSHQLVNWTKQNDSAQHRKYEEKLSEDDSSNLKKKEERPNHEMSFYKKQRMHDLIEMAELNFHFPKDGQNKQSTKEILPSKKSQENKNKLNEDNQSGEREIFSTDKISLKLKLDSRENSENMNNSRELEKGKATNKECTIAHSSLEFSQENNDLSNQDLKISEQIMSDTVALGDGKTISTTLFKQNHSFGKQNIGLNLGEKASVTPSIVCKNGYNITTDLLDKGEEIYAYTDSNEIKKIIFILEETLQQFNVEGKVVGIQRGPIITRFELKIAPGIKVNKILSLTDELAMALEALRVRIEAPIPGRSTVGIEIPNKKRAKVLLGDILRASNFQDFEGKLPLPIGKDIAGSLVIADLTKLPHLLIAGATGAGKSVSVNSFIVNFIINKSPEEIRFLMIDPKLVELSQYNDIPHLLHPVITDPQKSIAALNWAVEEMERRYEDLSEARVRDISSYNEKVQEKISSKEEMVKLYMPYIIILVDELGDLMMVAGKEVESSIIRLSQKARAVGIHLILATQRPSVDVITALIKANCPARIALQVAQKTDSRTILDSNGAEQLLGQGDSLFKHPTQGKLLRVQAPLVKDNEVEYVVEMAAQFAKTNYIILDDKKNKASKLDTEEEELFDEGWSIILENGKASASYLQRRLRIGYNKAARLMEAFEARGYIGPQVGSKPREILLSETL